MIDLDVSYHDRHAAKKLGARWNPESKLWQAPEGIDLAPFAAAGFVAIAPSATAAGKQETETASPARYTLHFQRHEPHLACDTIKFSNGLSRRMGLVVGRKGRGPTTAAGVVNSIGSPLGLSYDILDWPTVLAAAFGQNGALAIVDIDGVPYAFGYRANNSLIQIQTLATFLKNPALRSFANSVAYHAGPDSRQSWNSLIRLLGDDASTH